MQTDRHRVERLTEPKGIDQAAPEFTWQLVSLNQGDFQTAYQIEVDLVSPDGGVIPVWRSGKTASKIGDEVLYCGQVLASRSLYRWRLQVWDADDAAGPWSDWHSFETGVLAPDKIAGQWIGGGRVLRKEFELRDHPLRARAYVTGLGYYEFYCNGQKVSRGALAPSFTDFSKRVEYEIIDLTPLLAPGNNAVGFLMGDGWWRHHTENLLQAIAEIELIFADGKREILVSDASWSAAAGPIAQDPSAKNQQLFNGITYDARLLEPDWSRAGMRSLHPWSPAVPLAGSGGELVPSLLPPVRITEILAPKEIRKLSATSAIVDFGQNFAGWVRFTAKAPSGSEFVLRHAELLHPDGSLNMETLRESKSEDRYLLRGDPAGEVMEPHFTYHGFRYMQIEGPLEFLDMASIAGCVVHSDLEPTLEFSSSDDALNWLVSACRWTVRSNHYSVPTDCCQRNERRGWGMDGYLMSNSVAYFYDVDALFRKWHRDMCDNQGADGNLLSDCSPAWGPGTSLGWTRVIVMVPMKLYRMYGDLRLLHQAYPHMQAYCEHLLSNVKDDVLQESFSKHPAEWLCVGHKEKVLPDNALACDVLQTMSEAASLLGHEGDRQRYSTAGTELAKRVHRIWFDGPSGCYQGGTFFAQSNQVYPLRFGMVPEEHVPAVVDRLIDDLASARGKEPFLTTGIGSTVHLLEVLSSVGRDDLAWKIIQRNEYPGWGFMRENGATTIWERWEKMTYNQMNAHNHAGLSGVAGWVMRHIAGLAVKPGSEPVFTLSPAVHLPIQRLSVKWTTRWGGLAVSWTKQAGNAKTRLCVEIPTGCRAELTLRGEQDLRKLVSGSHCVEYEA